MAIEPDEDVDDDEYEEAIRKPSIGGGGGGPVNVQKYLDEIAERDAGKNPFEEKRTQTIADRERGTYNERRQKLQLSPGVRYDPFAEGSQTPEIHSVRRTTMAVMRETQVLNEKKELEIKLREKAKAGELKVVNAEDGSAKKKRRWDQTANTTTTSTTNENEKSTGWHEATTPKTLTTKDAETPMNRLWDPTPGHAEPGATTPPDITPGNLSETPRVKSSAAGGRRRWDETPKTERGNATETPHISGWAETPKVERLDDDTVVIAKQAALNANAAAAAAAAKKRSRWDETPVGGQTPVGQMTPSFTPSAGSVTPSMTSASGFGDMTPSGATPAGIKAMNLQTPVASFIPMTPDQMQALRYEREIDERNRPITDEELDELIPAGYKVCSLLKTY